MNTQKLAEENLIVVNEGIDKNGIRVIEIRESDLFDFVCFVRAETLEEAAEWCESKQSYNAMHANTEFAAGIRGLK